MIPWYCRKHTSNLFLSTQKILRCEYLLSGKNGRWKNTSRNLGVAAWPPAWYFSGTSCPTRLVLLATSTIVTEQPKRVAYKYLKKIIWLVVSTCLKNISQNMSKWESSPNKGENKTCLKPPPSHALRLLHEKSWNTQRILTQHRIVKILSGHESPNS